MTMQNDKTRDERDIRAVIKSLAGALHDKDAKRALGHYASDAVVFSLAPPLVQSSRNPESDLNAWFATWKGPVEQSHHDMVIETGGDIAFCRCLARLNATTVGGEEVELWFRLTRCFRRIAGAWKITHEHESVPLLMDGSFKAAIDLKP
jgi:ketosteroid isomerase-like protein